MTATMGQGEFTYRVQPGWEKLPPHIQLGDVVGLAVDSRDRVYVFNRSEHPMIVLDRDGGFIQSWEGMSFKRPHAVAMGEDDTIFCVDDFAHTVRKCTLDGKVLLEIGAHGEAALAFSGRPFNGCTHTALSPAGEIYVADGYGNARVHKYTPDGRFLLSWGEPGTDPGQFNVVHNICCDAEGWVYVADRENHRVQVFDGKGKYEAQWNNLHRPCGLYLHDKRNPVFYIGELGPMQEVNVTTPNIGPRLTITTREGERLARIGAPRAGTEDGAFIAPHTVAVDSRGDVYVGEVSYTSWNAVFPTVAKPSYIRSLQKLVRAG
jgi:DNA-binding beta-propeller fold protein YncE